MLGPDAVLATNTSSIPITRLGAATKRPGKVSYGVSSYGYDVRVGTQGLLCSTPHRFASRPADPDTPLRHLFAYSTSVLLPKDRCA